MSFFRTAGLSYSTCTVSSKTCPDQVCDSLEALEPVSICPQDCIPKSRVRSQIMFVPNPNWRSGLGRVRSTGLICSCHGGSCSCVSPKDAHSIFNDSAEVIDCDNGNTSSTISVAAPLEKRPLCDQTCGLYIGSGIASILLFTSIALFWQRKR